MNEIEKLYENANVQKEYDCTSCEYLSDYICPKCTDKQLKYPPFTAKKQLAILKILTQQCDLTISHFSEWEFIHYDGQEPLQVTGKDFTETFANLVNAYFQYLTKKEKAEIQRILEDENH